MENSRFEHGMLQTPDQELAYLREKIKTLEQEQQSRGVERLPHETIKEVVATHQAAPVENVLHPTYEMARPEVQRVVLDLAPEVHDVKMQELISILKTKGVRNALSVVDALNNPHISDDFHRFLVEYIREGMEAPGLKERTPLYKSLHMTLYEISLPEGTKDEQQRALKELISSMEQFYAGMLSVTDPENKGNSYFAIELAIPNYSQEFIFYAAVPIDKKGLFEKHILAIFPSIKIVEKKDDYNIFNEHGATAASYATSQGNPIFPIRTYEEFDTDPLNSILNSFSKIDKDGEGAAIQFIIRPIGDYINKKYSTALEKLKKGEPTKEAIDVAYTAGSEVVGELKKIFFGKGKKKKKDDAEPAVPTLDQQAIENVSLKIARPVVETNIRIVTSSRSKGEANEILADIESSFNQFANIKGNSLSFESVADRSLKSFLKDFSYRSFAQDLLLPLNLSELTTLLHFHTSALSSAPQLKQTKAGAAPAPLDVPTAGTLLGINRYRGTDTSVYMDAEDRLRHFYVIGQTGTGKSTMLKNMIVQDIQAGNGVCFIDPHGSDVMDILSNVPQERFDDVIYFDPSYTPRPMALNMLEYDRNYPEQKTFVVNELFSIFQKLYGAVPESMGPMFEQYFRNATMLVIEDPESGCTLLDVSKVLANKAYRQLKLSKCKNPIVTQFWREVAEKAGGEASLANIVPYITSKFDVFLANDIMRPIVAQEKSSFNFRDIMDQKKILLVNLAKGRLGDINANLIGLILVGKILMAALSRVDSFGKDVPPFYLYIDEFQNVTTNSIATILSEARKYKLALTVAHQFIAQLDEKIRDAVFGNVGSLASFRIGSDDAEYLEKQFAPVFTAADLMNIDNRNAYVRMLVRGRPVKPFNIEIPPPQKGSPSVIDALKALSYQKFGQDREIIEAAIMEKYTPPPPPPAPRPAMPATAPTQPPTSPR
jgi:hypothetical protein